ncbi:MAG: hypothetical protein QOF88_5546, partial [Mycobacterium sp.]|nr:hypothetical protein [Mycobacterium sp.]
MGASSEASVRDANQYVPPVITGLVDLLDRHVRDRPAARALVVTGDRVPVSYGALGALVEDVAARLGSRGLRRGDAVGLICANTIEFVVALLGAATAGLVVAPLDPALPESQMSARLEALGARAVLVGPTSEGDAPVAGFGIPAWQVRVDIATRTEATVVIETGTGLARHARGAAHELTQDDALVLFTSGTTN